MMNKVNFTCAPMFGNTNKQVFGYACTIKKKNIENFYVNDRGNYDSNAFYKVDDQVIFNGKQYKVIDQATSNGAQGYQPDTYSNVWQVVASPPPPPSGPAQYDSNKFYKSGDMVIFNNQKYTVIDQGTSNGAQGYQPDIRSNVWQVIAPAAESVAESVAISEAVQVVAVAEEAVKVALPEAVKVALPEAVQVAAPEAVQVAAPAPAPDATPAPARSVGPVPSKISGPFNYFFSQ